jgi:hypothetical protein
MKINLLWTGREYFSLENCFVESSPAGMEISSTIIGLHEGTIYKVEYSIKTNYEWETLFLSISCRQNSQMQTIQLCSDGKGNWTDNGKPIDQFKGCVDVDISLTPFTNTLPIRRLKLNDGESQIIKVIYCDLLKGDLRAVRQKYTRLSSLSYHYENIPNDFESVIQIDDHGLVVDYPLLFKRTAECFTE